MIRMISNIITTGKYLTAVPPIGSMTINLTTAHAGMVRYGSSGLEAFDGYSWFPVAQPSTIGLTWEAEQLLDWVRSKKLEEEKIDELCQTNPALHKARENFEIIKKLVMHEVTSD